MQRQPSLVVEFRFRGEGDDLAVAELPGQDRLADPARLGKVDPHFGVGGHDHGRPPLGVEHGDRAAEQQVQGGGDLRGAPAGEDDGGETLMNVEDALQAPALSIEQRAEHRCGHVGEHGLAGKGDQRHGLGVGRPQQRLRQWVVAVDANGDRRHPSGIEPAEQVLPGLVGGEQRLGARHDELARTHRSQQLRRRCGLCPAHLPVQAADPGDHLGVAAHGIDNRTDVKGSPHAPSLARRGTPADADAVVDVGCVPAERCRRCAGSLLGR